MHSGWYMYCCGRASVAGVPATDVAQRAKRDHGIQSARPVTSSARGVLLEGLLPEFLRGNNACLHESCTSLESMLPLNTVVGRPNLDASQQARPVLIVSHHTAFLCSFWLWVLVSWSILEEPSLWTPEDA
ncbi:hypothetical protein BV20DRAFT_489860 [Pilatotrama ljubarskyi]|nr:hypothetical protein BV20DRAFT_489860 [Pilatotrama ljubarskyi]